MYYVCHNIVKPLTGKDKLSYAEVAGPHEVEYFVSHYWGTPFRDYVSSMWKHAEAVVHSAGQPGLEITRTRYWICTLPRCPVLCVRPAPLCLFVEFINLNNLCVLRSGTFANNQWEVKQELGGGLG